MGGFRWGRYMVMKSEEEMGELFMGIVKEDGMEGGMEKVVRGRSGRNVEVEFVVEK